MKRRLASLCAGLAAISFVIAAPAAAQRETVLRVAMTAGDIPLTAGIPDQGFEGWRFVGYNLYDSLTLWDLSRSDVVADIRPGLATEWRIDPENNRRWLFTIRRDVRFHDGSPLTAADIVWNFDRFTKESAPQFNARQFAFARAYLGNFESAEVVDEYTVALTTRQPDSLFPYNVSFLMMVSPRRSAEVNHDADAFARNPSGTGPYRFGRMVPGERLELVRNPDYWDQARVPRHDRLVLLPMPEASTRTAALLSGQVDWIEAPAPDAIPRLRSSRMQVIAGHDPADPASATLPVPDFLSGLEDGVAGLRIGRPRHFYLEAEGVTPETIAALDRLADALADAGAIVEDVILPDYALFNACGRVILLSEAFAIHEQDLRARPQEYGEIFFMRLAVGAALSAADYMQAQRLRRELSEAVNRVALRQHDLLLTACALTPAPPFSAFPPDMPGPAQIQTMPFNVTGNPALSMPAGLSPEGLPLSAQLVGRPFEDALVLRAGRAVEKIVQGWGAPARAPGFT
ncbi:ABC transporter substrate-binding protein [Roseococcus thiosulfatophilus]|uniref:ABC transporter substrate-binding protein n=1 Tax=Roseococcus thiosulfatophilus TaxID=35813 RepID=UPI001A8D4224|nr:ABC transporter substrate-binding protein [Roseococcus thiosulfatophilus]